MRPTAPQEPEGGPPPSDRRGRRRSATRERLLAAALELFAAQGYAATTYDHIAERADAGRQTAFNHFRRKEDFVAAWLRQRHELLDRRDQADASDGRTAVEALAGELRALAELNERDYALSKELHDDGVLYSAFALGTATPRAFAATAARGRRNGEIRADLDPEDVADLVFDCYSTTLNRWLHRDGGFPLADALLARLAVLTTGFAAPSPAPVPLGDAAPEREG
ncbi:TetR/AcrR family transcriptional regulator [Streptomyces sp. NPDC057654]|uniref:TetR/AcrR family transcriptional regulator n=1 Tax=Streptomyces sp. NPDC057654 TaxID=3346196 RepID=UPI0036920978